VAGWPDEPDEPDEPRLAEHSAAVDDNCACPGPAPVARTTNGPSKALGRLAVCERAGMIMPMSIDVVYTAESTATGGGRDGHVKSTDGKIDLDTRPPKEMGGSGEGVNPELLFSAGFAACFLGALRLVARNLKIDLDDATGITTQIGFGKDSEGGFGLTANLIGYLPGLEQGVADDLMAKAHQVCPYSKATRGNIDVELSAKV
jgi:lipoyl-dependent peroxiredoxin